MSVYSKLKASLFGASVAAGLVITPMAATGHNGRVSLRTEQSSAELASHPSVAIAAIPQANTAPLIRPEEAPTTVAAGSFPADFKEYQFVDSRIATFKSTDPTNGETTRRRGIIAHMAAESGDPDGAHSKIDSYYTAPDLLRGGHPEAKNIIALLNEQTDSCIVAETGRAPATAQTPTAKPVMVAANSAKANAKLMQTAAFTHASA